MRIVRGRRARWAGALALALAAMPVAYGGGLVWFAESIPSEPATDDTTTDAIVVLTGGAARLATGIELLRQGRARKLFVSGVYRGVDVQELLRVQRQSPDEVACCIELGYSAESTEGNATETRGWVEREGVASLRLVTASYHMPRSLIEFRRAMPGLRIVAHPVLPDSFRRERWWAWPGSLRLVIAEYHKLLAVLLRPYVGASR
jgi:uncharacterized SAM-binding protein YcdF (DUF218 family)